MIDKSDGQIGTWILPKHDDIALTVADYIPQERLFWRRRIWEAVGGEVDPRFSYAMDWDLLLRFRDACTKMVRLPRFLGAFRIHDEQKTTSDYAVGVEETKRLHERVHGRDVPVEEVVEILKRYLTRHLIVHTRQRVVDRLPLRRIRVTTMPNQSTMPNQFHLARMPTPDALPGTPLGIEPSSAVRASRPSDSALEPTSSAGRRLLGAVPPRVADHSRRSEPFSPSATRSRALMRTPEPAR
jgi:hypothetical protein